MLGGRLACISLNGFVFFGCANSIGQRLQEVRGPGTPGDMHSWPPLPGFLQSFARDLLKL